MGHKLCTVLATTTTFDIFWTTSPVNAATHPPEQQKRVWRTCMHWRHQKSRTVRELSTSCQVGLNSNSKLFCCWKKRVRFHVETCHKEYTESNPGWRGLNIPDSVGARRSCTSCPKRRCCPEEDIFLISYDRSSVILARSPWYQELLWLIDYTQNRLAVYRNRSWTFLTRCYAWTNLNVMKNLLFLQWILWDVVAQMIATFNIWITKRYMNWDCEGRSCVKNE